LPQPLPASLLVQSLPELLAAYGLEGTWETSPGQAVLDLGTRTWSRPPEELGPGLTLRLVPEGSPSAGISLTLGTDGVLAAGEAEAVPHRNPAWLAAHLRALAVGEKDPAGWITDEERELLLGKWCGEPLDPTLLREETLSALFEATARAFPDRPALRHGARTWTYAALEAEASRLAHLVRSQAAGRCVGLWMPRSGEALVALLAILKAGSAYVPLDPEFPSDRVEGILTDAEAPLLLSHSALSGRLHPGPWLVLNTDGLDRLPEAARPGRGAAPGDVAYVIYTSGSTGRPKGVPIAHRAACNLVRTEARLFETRPEDRVYQGFSLAFDASVEEIWLAWGAGGCLVVAGSETVRSGPSLPDFLAAEQITILSTVPTLLATLEGDLPGLRLLILGGEACPSDLALRWSHGRRLVNTYGPTEATVVATSAELRPGDPVTIGRPLPNTRAYVLDEALRLLPVGCPGELCLAGPGLAEGYLRRPELTAQRFVPSPFGETPYHRLYRTGDLVRWDARGRLEFLGRLDEQVKLRGFRIELGEIEAVLRERPEVAACAVALRRDTGVDQLVAYLVSRPGAPVDPAVLRAFLRTRLATYMVPSRFESLAELPVLASGKVDRRRLPAPSQPVEARPLEGPATPLETRLLAAWRDLFHREDLGATDDFFQDLGGHSLLAALLVSRLRREEAFASLAVADVYAHPSIRAMAAEVAARTDRPRPTPAEPSLPVPPWRHKLCGLAQGGALYGLAAQYALQWVTPYLVFSWMVDHDFEHWVAILTGLGALLALYPLLFLLSIGVKWAVVGRLRAGSYPLWGLTYFRWWVMRQSVASTPVSFLAGTPLMAIYLRLMGAQVGANVHLASDSLLTFDLLEIGEGSSIGVDARLLGYAIEGGRLHLGGVRVGRDCRVGARSVLGVGAVMEDGSVLDNLSLLPPGARLPAGESWAGSPARAMPEPPPRPEAEHPTAWQRAWFGTLQGIGAFLVPTVYLTAILPGMLVLNLLYLDIPGYFLYLVAAPAVALSFMVIMPLEIAAVKWLLLGRVKAGTYRCHSWFFVRKWFFDQYMELSLDLLGPLYATLYLPPWFRLLGAKLGRNAEVSTAGAMNPDLLELEPETFIADAVSLGAPHLDRGWVTYAVTRVGERTFIGNSACIPGGTVLGPRSLVGVLSVPPADPDLAARPDMNWLGNPAIYLPHRQLVDAFGLEATFKPSRRLVALRYLIEYFRVTLPITGYVLLTSLLLTAMTVLEETWSLGTALLLFPVLYLAAGMAASLFTAGVKWLLMGRYHRGEKPLWCGFVWRTELVTALHENLAWGWLLRLLHGTPFLPWFFRLMGSRFGRRVCSDTSWLTEYDLISVGDEANLGTDATLQTHLFEDRVMKMSTVAVGASCSIGTDSVVLYDSRMEPGSVLGDLSLLMKGETLPERTRWTGSPAGPA
jgi:non-ribosomal peptide synthetase-like protein